MSRLRGRVAFIAIVVALMFVAVAGAFLPQLARDEHQRDDDRDEGDSTTETTHGSSRED
jgi:hypothetical protein